MSEWGQQLAPTFMDAVGALLEENTVGGAHPELTAMLAAAPASVKALLQPAHDKVAGWSFDTPSGVPSQDANLMMDVPTDAQIEEGVGRIARLIAKVMAEA